MTKLEKVLAGLRACTDPDAVRCHECPYEEECRVIDGGQAVMADALELLTPRVMTLEEACGADVCWLERKGKPVTVADLAFNGRDYEMDIDSRELNTLREYVLSSVYYGEYWRCWTQEPIEAQREEEAWDDE